MRPFSFPTADFKNPILEQKASEVIESSIPALFKAGLGLGELDAPANFISDMNTALNKESLGVEKKLTPEEANSQYGIPGRLNFDRDILPEAARVISERAAKEAAFDDVISRASAGDVNVPLLGQVNGFVLPGQFIKQMFDPINLPASMIPVSKIPGVSSLIGKLATKPMITQRAAAGAIEGIVGQAAVEPIYISGDQSNFEEHTTADIMRNMAFGTVFGAGLNVTIGGAFDGANFLIGKTLPQHKAASVTAFNQLLEGKIVNVEPILRADPQMARTEQVRQEIKNAQTLGTYGGPEGYGNITGPDTDLGLSNLKLFESGQQVIVNNIPSTRGKVETFELSGTQTDVNLGGSNPAKLIESEYGTVYFKPQKGSDIEAEARIKSEVLANKLYQLFGDTSVLPAELAIANGQFGVATQFSETAKPVSVDDMLIMLNDESFPRSAKNQVYQLLENTPIDMFLGNWDAMAFGNVLAIDGNLVKIDQGGALMFRAQGERKENFGERVDELKTMLDKSINPGARLYGQELTPELFNAGLAKLFRTDFKDIVEAVVSMGMRSTDEEQIIGILAARLNTLKNKFPDVASKVAKEKGKIETPTPLEAWKELLRQSRAMFEKLDELPKSQRRPLLEALQSYQEGSASLNQYLRTGRKFDTPYDLEIQDLIPKLDKLSEIGKLQEDTVLYRWTDYFDPNGDKGYMSTSLYEKKSPFHIDESNGINNILLVVHAPKSTKGFWPDASNTFNVNKNTVKTDTTFSHDQGGEFEFVIGRDTPYTVISQGVERTSPQGRKYKEMHIQILPEAPAKNTGPISIKELTSAATAYREMPSSAAEPETLLPKEATTFNHHVPKAKTVLEADVNPELAELVADLEMKAKTILSEAELKNLTAGLKDETDKTEGYIGGMQQAFTCWRTS